MLIKQPTNTQWQELHDNCLATDDDLAHINAFPYNGARVDAETLTGFLKNSVARGSDPKVWLIEEKEGIVGFVNFGSVIPWQRNAFGVVIGRRFTRKGYARKALHELISRKEEFGIREINGYCNRRNTAIIRLMEAAGFRNDSAFRDRLDSEAVKYCQAVMG